MAEHRAFGPLEQRRSGDDLEPVAKLVRELEDAFPQIHGRRVAVTFDGVTATVDAAHDLGRDYEGGWLMDASAAVADDCTVITGSVAGADGLDASTYVRVTQGTAQAVTRYVWVY